MKKQIFVYVSMFVAFLLVLGTAYAFFVSKSKILGSSFTVGSAELKLLRNVAAPAEPENLVTDLEGPAFDNIGPNWRYDYLIKIKNKGTSPVNLTTTSNYLTANDPLELRQLLFVEPIIWNDLNGNGVVDEGELGDSLGVKSFVRWKTEGYTLGTVAAGDVFGAVLRFSTSSVAPSKQGSTGIFDFEFNAVDIQ